MRRLRASPTGATKPGARASEARAYAVSRARTAAALVLVAWLAMAPFGVDGREYAVERRADFALRAVVYSEHPVGSARFWLVLSRAVPGGAVVPVARTQVWPVELPDAPAGAHPMRARASLQGAGHLDFLSATSSRSVTLPVARLCEAISGRARRRRAEAGLPTDYVLSIDTDRNEVCAPPAVALREGFTDAELTVVLKR